MRTTSSNRSVVVRKVAATAAAVGLSLLPFAAFGAIDTGINYGTATGLSTRDVREVIARIINVAMGLLGIVAVVIILAGAISIPSLPIARYPELAPPSVTVIAVVCARVNVVFKVVVDTPEVKLTFVV